MRALALLISIFILQYSMLMAQTGTIAGQIVSAKNAEAIGFSTVQIVETSLGTTANGEGEFQLDEVPVGSHSLLVRSVGYQNFTQKVVIENDGQVKLIVELIPDNLKLNEVVISGTRYQYDKANAPVVVNVLDNKILNATQSISIAEGLNYQPGVRVETNCQNCGFTQVRLNGLEGAYSQILINSRATFSALNSVYGLEQIPTNIVERVEVVRGGGSALYGSNAIAGTINIITKEPVENAWEVKSNTALIAGEAVDQTYSYNGSIVSESLNSGVTFYGMNRDREAYDANGDGFTELVQLENNVLGAKAFLKPNEQSKISLDFSALNEYRRGGDRLDLAPHFTDIAEELEHNTLFGSLNYDLWSENNRNQVSIYASTQSTNRNSFYGGLGGGRTAQDSALAINAYGLTEDLAIVAGTQFNHYLPTDDVLTLGVESQNYNTRDEIQGYSRLVDQQVNMMGFFGQYEWKPNADLTALIGARYDLTSVKGNYEVGNIQRRLDNDLGVFSPRVTLLYRLNENIRLRGGYARGFRAPQAFNEDLHISSVGGEPLFVILSDQLDKETSDSYTASINYSKNFGLTQTNFLLEGFYTQLQDPFTQVSTGAVLANGSIVEEVRNGEGASVSGVNFEAGYSPSSDFSFQLGGTAQQSLYDEPQILFEPENGSENVVSVEDFVRNPNLYGYFTTFYNVNESLKLDMTGTYTGSMVVPRVVGDDGFISLIESNSFFDLNLKASYHFDIIDDFHLEISGGVKNVFNSFQPEFDSGPERDSDFVYGPAMPRSVFVSVKIGNLH